jgi:hypothetical protein
MITTVLNLLFCQKNHTEIPDGRCFSIIRGLKDVSKK